METPQKSLTGTRILYAITKSNWGGAQAYTYALATGAREAGAQVSVAMGGANGTTPETGLLATRLTEASIPIIPLSQIKRDIGITRECKAFAELVRILKKEKPHVLHLNSSKMGLLGSLAGRLAGVPRIVFTAHGWPHGENRSLFWKTCIWIASWLTVAMCHVTIVVSEYDMRNAPVFFSKRKLHVIRNGIQSFELIPRAQARAEIIALSPGLTADSLWLLMNAELHPNKGIDVAIRALAELAPTYTNLVLVVMSEGQERERLPALARSLGIASKVFLPGFITDARFKLLAADIFLMPSRKEGLPLAILEAGIASLPVIASRVGGIPEIIQSSKNGLLVGPNDALLLANAIQSLLSDRELAHTLGISLHEKVATEFTSERMTAETFKTYR
ncbi:glycosyltransferase family 4 protein [soil metagenome]